MISNNKSQVINVKLQFKGKIFILGQNIFYFDEILKQINLRFPEQKAFHLLHEDNVVTDMKYVILVYSLMDSGAKSIKLEMRQGQAPSEKKNSKRFSFDQEQFQEITIQSEQNKKNQKINPNELKFHVQIQQDSCNLTQTQGKQYYWSCIIQNLCEFTLPKGLFFIKDLVQNKLMPLNLELNESKYILLGPYTQQLVGRYTHFYQIVYQPKKNAQFVIGNRFGFVCNVEKKINKIIINNKMFQRVNQLRNFTSCDKSTENIIMKLKELGIKEDQIHHYDDQTLIDMFEDFSTSP